MLAGHLLYQRTNGRIDFFADDLIRKASLFPLRTLLSPNRFANFSDCEPEITLPVPLLAFLARHYQLDDLMRLANAHGRDAAPQSQPAAVEAARAVLATRSGLRRSGDPGPARLVS